MKLFPKQLSRTQGKDLKVLLNLKFGNPALFHQAAYWDINKRFGIELEFDHSIVKKNIIQSDICYLRFYDSEIYPHYIKFALGNTTTFDKVFELLSPDEQIFFVFNMDLFC